MFNRKSYKERKRKHLRKEIEVQLAVELRYDDEVTDLETIKKKVQEAIDSVACCDIVKDIYRFPENVEDE